MAANYDLIASQSSIQVISPTVVLDVIVATVQTKPHGVIFDYWIAKDAWDAGVAPTLLSAACAGVERIMSTQPVTAAVGNRSLDASGLLAENITFTVAYRPVGSTGGLATVDVDVPVLDFSQDEIGGHNTGLEDAAALIQDAYAKLKEAADGPVSIAVSGGSGSGSSAP